MSAQLSVLSLVYVAEQRRDGAPATIFDAAAAAALKRAEAAVIDHKDFPAWCKRTYAGAEFVAAETRVSYSTNRTQPGTR